MNATRSEIACIPVLVLIVVIDLIVLVGLAVTSP